MGQRWHGGSADYASRTGLPQKFDYTQVDKVYQSLKDNYNGKLTEQQVAYAASDVLHLHALRTHLDGMLARAGRTDLAASCFEFLPTRARLDLLGWEDEDIFAHS